MPQSQKKHIYTESIEIDIAMLLFNVLSNAMQRINGTASTPRASTSASSAQALPLQPLTSVQKEEAHAPKQALGLPSLKTWEFVVIKKPQWDAMCKNTFNPDHMRACANCGVTAINPNAHFSTRYLSHWPTGKKIPAALAYPHLLQARPPALKVNFGPAIHAVRQERMARFQPKASL
eukprot:1139580-Pelagomonas_calceolata.AAC.2